MADARVQLEAEAWVRDNWLPRVFGQHFESKPLKLAPGGTYNFNAVSADGKIAVAVATSQALTASGKRGSGKMLKIRSDILFLLMSPVERRILVFTEPDMLELCEDERRNGRTPDGIEFTHAALPTALALRLQRARRAASVEVTPSG